MRFETFCSSGRDGQNVNKVETGIRVIYIPTGLTMVSTEARSQQVNKKLALNRLCETVSLQNAAGEVQVKTLNWLKYTRLQRGNPVWIYEGIQFKRIEQLTGGLIVKRFFDRRQAVASPILSADSQMLLKSTDFRSIFLCGIIAKIRKEERHLSTVVCQLAARYRNENFSQSYQIPFSARPQRTRSLQISAIE